MHFLSQLSVRASVMLFLAAAIGAILFLSGHAWHNTAAAHAVAQTVLQDVRTVRAAGALDMAHDALRADVLAAQITGAAGGEADKAALRQALRGHLNELSRQFSQVQGGARDAAVQAQTLQVEPVLTAYADSAEQVVAGALGGAADLAARRRAFDAAFGALEVSLGQLSGQIEAAAGGVVDDQAALFASTRRTVAAVGALATALLGLAGVAFLRVLWARLGAEPQALCRLSQRIAAGDLVAGLARPAPAGSVAAAMHQMQQVLSRTVGGILQGAESVALASQQIARGNQDLAARTEEQASALEQTTATMSALGADVGSNADNARQADALARGASQVAIEGGAVVARVVQTMTGINDASRRIADIVTVIDGIAFQTNILALNAAVEAARAGEQGRGFAVVAGEVRTLAGRSATAAREIKSLIQASVERVDQGTELVGQAGRTMDDIVAAIQRVQDIVGQISADSLHQHNSVQEVGLSVRQLDSHTQQNASLVEQAAASADGLREQAASLVDAVAVFGLEGVASRRATA